VALAQRVVAQHTVETTQSLLYPSNFQNFPKAAKMRNAILRI
jgi:hypothetical protein